MRNWAIPVLSFTLAVFSAPSWSIPEAMTPSPAGEGEQTASAYEAGRALAEKADLAVQDAANEADPKRQEEALKSTQETYAAALQKFQEAADADPTLPGAWNMVGYTERKLGNYDAALAAYGRALALRPNFAEAIAYRGEAYLGLNRVADAQQAYLDLFAMNRVLADQYLDAIQKWVVARRSKPAGAKPSDVKQMEKWVKERSKIAASTAALTREGAGLSWR